MIPLKDEIKPKIKPAVTFGIIALNILVFLFQLTLSNSEYTHFVDTFGLVPAYILERGAYIPLITSMFIHGDLMHIFGNMIYLYIFGDNIEDICDHTKFIIFYLLCGIVASILLIAIEPDSEIPIIGASGAISGILGAYVVKFPNTSIRTAVFTPFLLVVYIPAYLLIGFWFVYQLILAFIGIQTGVAYWAHIGGFLAGLITIKIYSRKKLIP